MPKPLLTPIESLNSTKDYRHHRAHACVGLYVLVHFIYRYALFFLGFFLTDDDDHDHDHDNNDDDMGFEGFVLRHSAAADIESTTSSYFSYSYHYFNFHFNFNSYLYIILLFIPHGLSQLSGFGFSIPKLRHPDGNRIWPQYRFEALVFFCRCMTLLIIAFHRKLKQEEYRQLHLVELQEKGQLDNNEFILHQDEDHPVLLLQTPSSPLHLSTIQFPLPLLWNSIIVFTTMIAADIIAKYYNHNQNQNQNQSTTRTRTIRDLKAHPSILYLMSATQFHATLNSLLTTNKLSVQIVALGVVQLSAFGMTLRRKSLITQTQGVVLYVFVLLLGMIVIVNDLMLNGVLFMALSIGNITALVRFELRLNKYILWMIVILFLYMTLGLNGYWTYTFHHTTIESERVKVKGLMFEQEQQQQYYYWDEKWFFLCIGSTIALLFGALKRQYENDNIPKSSSLKKGE